jgi:bacteriocin-like protein
MSKANPETTKAKSTRSPDALVKVGEEGGITLTEEELESVSGGVLHRAWPTKYVGASYDSRADRR